MTSYSRESWQDPKNPITGPKPKAKRTVGVVHYSGSNSIPKDYPAWLRSMQNDYTKNRGYSLGYGYMVPGNGDDYEIRGADFNMASNNGDKVNGNANDWTLSILLDVTTTSAATPAQIETCKRIFAAAGIYSRPVPHSFYDYTSCCGGTVTNQINQGLFDQGAPPPEPTPPSEESDMLGLDFGKPGVDSWWTRMTWTGTQLCHTVSPSDQFQTRAQVPVYSIEESELSTMLDTVQTIGDSPFYEGGQAPNAALHVKWQQAQGRT
jgi:hypothetical protein